MLVASFFKKNSQTCLSRSWRSSDKNYIHKIKLIIKRVNMRIFYGKLIGVDSAVYKIHPVPFHAEVIDKMLLHGIAYRYHLAPPGIQDTPGAFFKIAVAGRYERHAGR